jgi:carbonic anhydrase/acetyltransferase-like protein (isoleucine patch superfamily)
MKYKLGDKQPTLVGEGHYIAPGAAVIGDCVMHANTSVWFNVVIRADADTITIGEGSNIQDGAVLHVDPGYPMSIGENVTVGHKAMLHGCTVGDGSLVGINAVVLNGAKIGKGCLVGANALVPEGMDVPDGSMVLGSPARIKKTLSDKMQQALAMSDHHYVENGARFNAQLQEVTDD